LFAVFSLLLYKHSAQNSFVVGTAVNQRSMAQLQEAIGFSANMLPIRTTIDDDVTFAEYLETFRHDSVTDLANDEATYEDIVSQTKSSSQDRSYFKHLFAPGWSQHAHRQPAQHLDFWTGQPGRAQATATCRSPSRKISYRGCEGQYLTYARLNSKGWLRTRPSWMYSMAVSVSSESMVARVPSLISL
jgi:hypothetical protein